MIHYCFEYLYHVNLRQVQISISKLGDVLNPTQN